MKKNIALILSIIFCLGLAACGNKDENVSDIAVANNVIVDEKKDIEEKEVEKEEEIWEIEIPEEYVLVGNEQYRITDTVDISMEELCVNYAYPFDIVIPVVEGCEVSKSDDMTFYKIFNSNMDDSYSLGFVTERRSGGRMFVDTGVDGEIFANGKDMAERSVPTTFVPSVYYQYNSLDNGEYTLCYTIKLYRKKTVAEANFHIRNNDEASEADETYFRLQLDMRKEVGVDRSEYMLEHITNIKNGILAGMGIDEAFDKETLREVNKELLDEKTDGKGVDISLAPQKGESQTVDSTETEDIQYEEVIGDVDVDTSQISVSDMSELVVDLDFKVDDSIYDYDSLGLKDLTILAPGSLYITGYTDSGIEAVFDAFDVTIKCQTTNVALQAGAGDVILADTDRYVAYRWTTSDENNDNRSYQRYIIYDKNTGAGMNIHLEISKHDVNAANAFINGYLPAFETTLANNF